MYCINKNHFHGVCAACLRVDDDDFYSSDAQTNTEEQLKASKTAAIQFLDSHASDMTRDDEIPVLLQKSLEWEDVSGTEVPFASHGSR